MVTLLNYGIRAGGPQEDFIQRYHKHDFREHQCTSFLVKYIKAHLPPSFFAGVAASGALASGMRLITKAAFDKT